MSKLPPYAVLLATLTAVIGIIVVDAPMAILGLGGPAGLVVFATKPGRRIFARRLLVTVPLLGVAVLLRWFEQAPARDSLAPAFRVVSAVAWSSCLSTLLGPHEMRIALRALGVPRALVDLLAHTRRFALQLAATASEAWNAATLRAGLFSLRATAETVGHVAGVVVVRALDRAECVAIAGALRGAHFADEAPLEAGRASHEAGFSP